MSKPKKRIILHSYFLRVGNFMLVKPGAEKRSFNRLKGRYSSGQRGQTVNLLTYVFTGSNPVLPTQGFKFEMSDFEITQAGVAQLVER